MLHPIQFQWFSDPNNLCFFKPLWIELSNNTLNTVIVFLLRRFHPCKFSDNWVAWWSVKKQTALWHPTCWQLTTCGKPFKTIHPWKLTFPMEKTTTTMKMYLLCKKWWFSSNRHVIVYRRADNFGRLFDVTTRFDHDLIRQKFVPRPISNSLLFIFWGCSSHPTCKLNIIFIRGM